MSRAAVHTAVISVFFRHNDLLTLPVYPTSSNRWIMSSTSNDCCGWSLSLSLLAGVMPTELAESVWGRLSAADPGVDALGLERIVEARGMSSGGRLDFLLE